ncbi:hypothetical protein D3C75_916410 [compost metagenome]
MAANQTGRQVTQCAGTEPQAHHLAAHSFRCQQGHGCQPNRAKAQFAQRQHQNTAHQPQRRYAGTTVAQHVLCGQHHQAKARSGKQNTDNKLGDTAQAHFITRQSRPCPAKYRCQQDNKQRVDGLEPHRRDLEVANHPVGIVVGEQVERGRFLLEG